MPDTRPDRIDRILAQWASQRPDLDCTPMGLIGRLGRVADHVGRRVAEVLAAQGLPPGGFDVLASLRRAGPPFQLSPHHLLAQMMVTSGTMTNRIDQLEKLGLVSRQPNPDDRRGVVIALTAAGLALVDRVVDIHLDNERHLLAGLDDADRADLDRVLRRWLACFETP